MASQDYRGYIGSIWGLNRGLHKSYVVDKEKWKVLHYGQMHEVFRLFCSSSSYFSLMHQFYCVGESVRGDEYDLLCI